MSKFTTTKTLPGPRECIRSDFLEVTGRNPTEAEIDEIRQDQRDLLREWGQSFIKCFKGSPDEQKQRKNPFPKYARIEDEEKT